MLIREAVLSDVAALALVASKTYAETFGDGLIEEELSSILRTTRSEAYFREALGCDVILVAFVDGRLVGYIQICDAVYDVEGVMISAGDQAIHAVYVDSKYQGVGVGKDLMSAALGHPRLDGVGSLFIDVYGENHRALDWYRRLGFVEVGLLDVVVDGTIIGHDLLLKKKLTNNQYM